GENQTPPAWELYDLVRDPDELNNVYDNPSYQGVRDQLKMQLAELRQEIGDDGSHYPNCEKVVQEFWDDSPDDRKKAVEISGRFRQQRETLLQKTKRGK
ncbi:MAG: sulfatase/phosphatase domain-containing protein, partial [Planctomycetota bacterium]